MSSKQEDLFDVLMLDAEELSTVVLTNNYESDFAFAYFDSYIGDEDITEMSQEDIMGLIVDYTDVMLPSSLQSTDDFMPMVTRMVLTESSVILTIALEQPLIDYLDKKYDSGADIEHLFEDESETPDTDTDDDEPEDEWEV